MRKRLVQPYGQPTPARAQTANLTKTNNSMPNRPKKTAKSVLEGLPVEQPPGENFFLANVEIDTPADPCWNDGFSVVGSWKVVSGTISRYLVFDPRARHSIVRVFQGTDARRKMIAGIKEEARYQEQKRAQPNN